MCELTRSLNLEVISFDFHGSWHWKLCFVFFVALYLANLGAEGQRKITVEKGNNTESLEGGARVSGTAARRQTAEVDVAL